MRRLTSATNVAYVGTPCREMRRFAERCSLWSHIYLIWSQEAGQSGQPLCLA
nr:MAG TPA: hypothetical protein [Microviridae sp.]